MIVLHSRGRRRQRASAVRWWLEVKALTIALVIACLLAIAFAAFVALALFGCDGAGTEPRPPEPAPSSYAVKDIPPGSPAQLPPATSLTKVILSPPHVRHPTAAGKPIGRGAQRASCVAKRSRLTHASDALTANPAHPNRCSLFSKARHPAIASKRTARRTNDASCVARSNELSLATSAP
jgi:hypothetical protein